MATVVRRDQLELMETPGSNFTTGLATRARGANEVIVILQQQAAGGRNPLHTHDREETMVLRAGRVSVTVGDELVTLAAGDTLIVPANTAHRIENAGDERAEWLLIAPAGMRFFGAAGEGMGPAWAEELFAGVVCRWIEIRGLQSPAGGGRGHREVPRRGLRQHRDRACNFHGHFGLGKRARRQGIPATAPAMVIAMSRLLARVLQVAQQR